MTSSSGGDGRCTGSRPSELPRLRTDGVLASSYSCFSTVKALVKILGEQQHIVVGKDFNMCAVEAESGGASANLPA